MSQKCAQLSNLSFFAVVATVFVLTGCSVGSLPIPTHEDAKQVTLPDGSVYQGQVNERGLLSGTGVLKWRSGRLYIGEFKDGQLNGRGYYSDSHGEQLCGRFQSGEFVNGCSVGMEGDVRAGAFSRGKLEGESVASISGGFIYVGEMQDGYEHGRGRMIAPNGDLVIGDFVRGKLHGEARVLFAAGGSFVGTYVDGYMDGEGVLAYANGDLYEGGFGKDMPSGCGMYKKRSGDVYVGGFRMGEFHGKGVYVRASGDKLRGYFIHGEFVGEAIVGKPDFGSVNCLEEK